MKRRSLGIIATVALAGVFAAAQPPAFADDSFELSETYKFSSKTSITYTITVTDPSGQITQDKCKNNPGDSGKAVFRTEGSTSICEYVQTLSGDSLDELLTASGSSFTFTSKSGQMIKEVFKGRTFKKVTVNLPSGWKVESAEGNGIVSSDKASVTWNDVTENVAAKGSTGSSSSLSSSSASPSASSSASRSSSKASTTPIATDFSTPSLTRSFSPRPRTSESTTASLVRGFFGVLVLLAIGGAVAAAIIIRNKKKNQAQFMGVPGIYPAPFDPSTQPYPGQYQEQPQYYPAQPQPGQYPPQGQMPPQQAQPMQYQAPVADLSMAPGQYPAQPGFAPQQQDQFSPPQPPSMQYPASSAQPPMQYPGTPQDPQAQQYPNQAGQYPQS